MEEDPHSPNGSGAGWFERLKRRICPPRFRSREDILTAIDQATEDEFLSSSCHGLIKSVLEFDEIRVRDIMIPRGQMDVVDIQTDLPDLLDTILETGHSRYPVIGENRDEVIGVLLVKELLRHYSENSCEGPNSPDEVVPFNLRPMLRAPMFVPESKRLDALLAEFRLTRTHMAIVLDEFGGVAGLVTIEDVLEEIVGDIDDEYDIEARTNIQQQGVKRFTVRALTPIDEFNDHFGTEFSDDEYDTIGGLVTHELGHLPRRGELVRMGGFEFKVLGADKRRLHLLLATRVPVSEYDTVTDEE
jgi:magnesium and cobalt transporter